MALTFTNQGTLPAGIHKVTWQDLLEQFAFTQHRAVLIGGLRAALISLATAGCQKVWLDGSFTTLKPNPNDIDLCYDDSTIDFDLLDPVLLEFENARATQKDKFGCECFGASWIAEPMTGLNFLAYFQLDRANQAKGILELDLRTFKAKKARRVK